MKWLKRTGEFRRKEFEKSRSELHDRFERIEERSPECAMATRVEFGMATRKVCTLSSSSAATYSQQFQVGLHVRYRRTK